MNIINKFLYYWHIFKAGHFESLVKDCLSPSLRKRLIIKADYHRELALEYSNTISI